MDSRLIERMKNVLQAVIMEYICTGKPVGSGILSKNYIPDLSPATIRNIMSTMEEVGYLVQPHASAGRIPTDKGFRFYVDTILHIKELPSSEKKKIKIQCQNSQDIEGVMCSASNILSVLSNCMGVVLSPRFDNIFIRHIEFIKLGHKQIMVLLVSNSGITHNRIIKTDEELKQTELESMSGYLNDIAKGLTIKVLRAKIIEQLWQERNIYNRLFSKALKLSKMALDGNENTGDIYVEGKLNIFDQPEFREDMENMKLLFRTLEEKSALIKILDKSMEARGVQVFIGSENELNEVKGCSVITAPYNSGGNILGTIGVIGPRRMNYAKVIPLVNYTAYLLSDIMTGREAV